MRGQIEVTPALQDYISGHSLREPDVLRSLREATEKFPARIKQVPPEEGQFLGLLARAVGARRALEVGTFTGYSMIAIALALPSDGLVLSCDINPETSDMALDYAQQADVANKVDLRVGDAQKVLAALVARTEELESFDFAFIDANKEGYPDYYEAVLRLVRPGGLIVVDNVLWSGAVADETQQGRDTQTLRRFNEKLRDDDRVFLSLIPFADGLTLAVKR